MLFRFVLFCAVLLMPFQALALVPNDPFLADQWYLERIGLASGWNITTGSSEVLVAVIDAGVDMDHPDLAPHLWKNPWEVPGDGIDNEMNGYVDDVSGWDFIDRDNDPSALQGIFYDPTAISHGTLVSGLIGAVGNNGIGISGVAWNVRILPLRILDTLGSGNAIYAVSAIDYAVAAGADVINLSFSGFMSDIGLIQAVNRAEAAGVIVVAALGNTRDGGIDTDIRPLYPACIRNVDHDPLIGVTATDHFDRPALFSNFGSFCADLAAPGDDIFGATYQDERVQDFLEFYDGPFAGTSLAAPLVSGAAALIRSVYPEASPGQVKTFLQQSAEPLAPGGTHADGHMGAGRLHIGRALEAAQNFFHSVHLQRLIATFNPSDRTVRLMSPRGEIETSFVPSVALSSLAVGSRGGETILATAASSSTETTVTLFHPDGSQASQFSFPEYSDSPWQLALGQLDEDADSELMLSGSGGRFFSFEQDGAGVGQLLIEGMGDSPLRLTALDVDQDRLSEFAVASAPGLPPVVRLIDRAGITLREFPVYAPSYLRGLFVAAGDVNGDGVDDIITGTDMGGGPHVQVYSTDGRLLTSFFAYDPAFRGGVHVTVKDIDGNGLAEILTSPGPGGGPHMRIFNGRGEALGGFFVGDEGAREGLLLGL